MAGPLTLPPSFNCTAFKKLPLFAASLLHALRPGVEKQSQSRLLNKENKHCLQKNYHTFLHLGKPQIKKKSFFSGPTTKALTPSPLGLVVIGTFFSVVIFFRLEIAGNGF